MQPGAVRRRRERGDDARVEPAAQVRADRHVGAQVEADRVGEQLAASALVKSAGVVEVGLEVDLPVAARLDVAVADAQEVAGQQLADALEQRLAGEAELEGEVVLEAVEVGLDRRARTAAAP